jgi:uncharacterized protein (DUF362 family)
MEHSREVRLSPELQDGCRVSISRTLETSYPDLPPFDPSVAYPESQFPGRVSKEPNHAYAAVREALRLLNSDGWDRSNWNPLSGIVNPGDRVFLKPNMIAHRHQGSDEWAHVITHGSVIRAVIDYVYIALKGQGSIVIGDAPQTDSDFSKIIDRMGLREIQQLYMKQKTFAIDVLDLRDECWVEKDGIYVETTALPGDPCGSLAVDLARASTFADFDGKPRRYYGAYYDIAETNAHHHTGKHEYAICQSPVSADVFINIPKLKTHKKCGITVNLKSLVGINANKNWLPHYVFGAPETGGDQFPKTTAKSVVENLLVVRMKHLLCGGSPVARILSRKTKRSAYSVFGGNDEVVRSGNWYGNDTVWRMCIDLNRILLYANPDGTMRDADRPKRFFSVVDGILAMEGNGPVAGTVKPAGIIVAGINPVSVDFVCAALMSFDYRKLALIKNAFGIHPFPLAVFQPEDVVSVSNESKWTGVVVNWPPEEGLHFEAHFAWKGKIERSARGAGACV